MTYHVSVVPLLSVIVITSPFENEISPGWNTNHVNKEAIRCVADYKPQLH